MSEHTVTEWNRHITPDGTSVTATHITDQQKIDALVEALKLLLGAMETGHYRSFTLKGSCCPKCNIAWPCGYVMQAIALAQQGTP